MHPRQVQHQQEVLTAHMQKGFRAADLGDFHGHRQLQVIIITGYQADMAGAHAKAEFAFADRTQVNIEWEMHEVGETHFVAADAPWHQVDRRLGEQLSGEDSLRLVVDLGGLAALDYPPLMKNGGGATQGQGLVGLGGGIYRDGVARLEQFTHFLTQLFAQFVVQVDQRLIEQNQFSVFHQGAGHGGALLLATGQFQGVALQEFLDA